MGLYLTAAGRLGPSFTDDCCGPEAVLHEIQLIWKMTFLTTSKGSQRTFVGESEYHSEY